MICARCKVAPLLEEDRYCFWCGDDLRAVEWKLEPDPLLVDPARMTEPLAVCAQVHYAGQFPSRVRLDVPSGPWMVPGDGEAVDEGSAVRLLSPGGSARFPFQLHAEPALAQGGLEVRLLINEKKPGARTLTHALPIFRRPQVEVHTDQGPVWVEGEAPLELRVTVRGDDGASAQVDDVRGAEPWVVVSRFEPRPTPVAHLSLDPAAIRASLGAERRETLSVPLRVRTLRPDIEVPVVLALPVRWPPELLVEPFGAQRDADGTHVWSARPGRVAVFDCDLSNPGGRPLALQKVAFDPPDRLFCVKAPTAENPVVVWQTPHPLELLADLRDDDGPLEAEVRFYTDGSETPARTLRLRIKPTERTGFDGAVAIDFGTTNSCVAVWPRKRDEPSVGAVQGRLRRGRSDPTSAQRVQPSNVLYHFEVASGTEMHRGYSVGIGPESVLEAPYLARSAKRYLATPTRYDVKLQPSQEARAYPAEVVAGDIVRRLLEGAEDLVDARITRCAVTHPLRFSYRQIEALRDLFEREGVTIGRMVPEPVAAAIGHAVSSADSDLHEADYHLLVFDIGGGTTDLALVRVRMWVDPVTEVRHLHPEVRALHGLRWAGGDDITWIILENFLTRLRDPSLKDDEVEAMHSRLVLNADHIAILEEQLRDRAADPTRYTPLLTGAFAIAEGAKLRPPMGTKTDIIPGKAELDGAVDRFLAEKRILEEMRKPLESAGLATPDVVLLVGQSWHLPRLRERIEAEFPMCRFHPPRSGETDTVLKEVVALGACIAETLDRDALGVELHIDDLLSTVTTRIGVAQLGWNGRKSFRQVIGPSDPLGKWVEVKGVNFDGSRNIVLLENTDSSDEMEVLRGGERLPNPEIAPVGTARFDESVLQQAGGERLRAEGRLEMQVTAEQKIELRVVLRGEGGEGAMPEVRLAFERPVL